MVRCLRAINCIRPRELSRRNNRSAPGVYQRGCGDSALLKKSSGQFLEQRFHLRTGVLVARLRGCGNSGGEDGFGLFGARFAGKELRVHEIGGDVGGVTVEQRTEMGVCGGSIAGVHALHRKAVTRESVVRFLSDELFKHLPAGFLLVRHCVVSYYTQDKRKDNAETQRLQVAPRRGERDEAEDD